MINIHPNNGKTSYLVSFLLMLCSKFAHLCVQLLNVLIPHYHLENITSHHKYTLVHTFDKNKG
jgi:hypothetical protein